MDSYALNMFVFSPQKLGRHLNPVLSRMVSEVLPIVYDCIKRKILWFFQLSIYGLKMSGCYVYVKVVNFVHPRETQQC